MARPAHQTSHDVMCDLNTVNSLHSWRPIACFVFSLETIIVNDHERERGSLKGQEIMRPYDITILYDIGRE